VNWSALGFKIWAEYTWRAVLSTILWAIAGMIARKLRDEQGEYDEEIAANYHRLTKLEEILQGI
jgi:hypothetical protein